MLRVVDEQVADAAAFAAEQFGVGREGRQRRTDQFGGVDRRCRCTGRLESDCAAQQHVLLVLGVGTGRGGPLGAFVFATQRREFFRADAAFGGPHHQVAQGLREAVGAECRP